MGGPTWDGGAARAVAQARPQAGCSGRRDSQAQTRRRDMRPWHSPRATTDDPSFVHSILRVGRVLRTQTSQLHDEKRRLAQVKI